MLCSVTYGYVNEMMRCVPKIQLIQLHSCLCLNLLMSLQPSAFSKILLPPMYNHKKTCNTKGQPFQVSTFAVAAIVPVRFMGGFSSDEVLNLRVWARVRPSFSSCNTEPLA